MKTIVSLTSIPSRFKTLPAIVYDLEKRQGVDEIWVNIPYKYNRFPDAEVVGMKGKGSLDEEIPF